MRKIALALAAVAATAGCASPSSDTSAAATPTDPCAVLTGAELSSIFGTTVDDGVHDPAEDIGDDKTCAWAPPGKNAGLDKVLMVTPLSSQSWKEELDWANGKYNEHTLDTLTKKPDPRVANADEAFLVTSTGIDGPGSSSTTVQYVYLLVRRGSLRLNIQAFVGSELHSQDATLEAPLDEKVAAAILRKKL